MSLITSKTQLQIDLDAKDESVLRSAEAMHHTATVIKNENIKFWSLPTDRLLAVLNYNIPQTLSVFAANAQAAVAINALLDAVDSPRFSNRLPTEMGRNDVMFDGNQFVVIPPEPPEEQEPEEELPE